ncbi:MAG: ABC transporter substrate-binding protein, partial [Desulfobacteraceae bacterium]|nr:ABC transporter substrate-binding protein [Desulfobacteraceae bacterium]
LMVIFAAVAAAGRADAKTAEQVLKFAVHTSTLTSLDPHFANGSQDATFADMVFNSLVRYAPGNLSLLEPDIAESIPGFYIKNGRQIWTIHLKKGILFHSGPFNPAYELTADDVIFSLKKTADPARSLISQEYKGMIFEKHDDYTLDIILEKPVSPLFFLPTIADHRGGYIVSKKAIQAGGYDAFTKHPVGTGPFMFDRYEPEEKCVLKAHSAYFRGIPQLAGVEMHFIPDNDDREAAFRKGDMDLILGVGDPGWIQKMEKLPQARIDVFGPGFTGLFHLNTVVSPLDDIRVRKAIIHALDRDHFLAASTRRLVTPVLAPMSADFLPGGMENEKIIALGLHRKKDISRARQLLADAGFADGFSFPLYVSEKRLFTTSYEILQQALADIGIMVDLKIVSHSQYHQLIRQNKNAIVLYFSLRPNADEYLRGFFHSESIVETGSSPHTNFSHCTVVDKLLDDARSEIDPKKQIRLWEQAQIRILHEALVYPLLDIKNIFAKRPNLDYGHELKTTLAGYPQFDERTSLSPLHQ